MKRSKASLQLLVLVMLFMYFLNSFKVIQPLISYSLNYDYISKVLCINKDNPDAHCNGKCHLSKELKKAAEADSDKKEVTSKFELSEVVPSEEVLIVFDNYNNQTDKQFPVYLDKIATATLDKSTPPPRG